LDAIKALYFFENFDAQTLKRRLKAMGADNKFRCVCPG
jgi:hypothetical protein